MTRQRIPDIILLLFGIIVALSLCEIGLRFLSFRVEHYYIWPPHLHSTFKPLPDITPGIHGESRFIVNSKGIRADELTPDCRYKILALGGSSTECTFLDQQETWPWLLQERLARAINARVWVGNAGKSGNTTHHNILQMRYLLQDISGIDAVIVLAGINDLTIALSRDSENTKQDEHEEDEEIEVGKVPGEIPVIMHVAVGIYVDNKGNARDDHHHDDGERVDQEADVRLKLTGKDPLEQDFFHRAVGGRQLKEVDEDQQGDQEGEADRGAGDKTHGPFGNPPPPEKIDGKPERRE